MGALFIQRKSIANGRTTMSNTPKATPKTVADATEKQDVTVEATAVDPKVEKTAKTVPAQATGEDQDGEQTPKTGDETEKLTLVQRAKALAEKLKQNKKAVLILTGAAVVVGLTIKNNRKAVSVEPLDEAEGPVIGTEGSENPDDTTDSL
jgi:hypothetical protein